MLDGKHVGMLWAQAGIIDTSEALQNCVRTGPHRYGLGCAARVARTRPIRPWPCTAFWVACGNAHDAYKAKAHVHESSLG